MKLKLEKLLSRNYLPFKRTKMTATIGPASTDKEILR